MRALIMLASGLLAPLAWPGALPEFMALALLLISFFLLLIPDIRILALLTLGLCWTSWHIEVWTGQRVLKAHDTLPLSGQVVSLPLQRSAYLEFEFLLQQPSALDIPGRTRLLVRWHGNPHLPEVGENWSLPLRVRPPAGRVNLQGSDIEAWLFTQGVAGLATVGQGPVKRLPDEPQGLVGGWLRKIHGWRADLRERLLFTLEGHPGKGLVVALSVADRSYLRSALREAMVSTGTGHLLAISGMHIGMVALFGLLIGRALLLPVSCVTTRWSPVLLAWLGALILAGGYAALAGFATSTRRALIMLLVLAVCVLMRRSVSPYQGLLSALLIVLVLNPVAPAAPGFWLSFAAVGLLIYLFTHRITPPAGFQALPFAQLGISIVMLPLGLYWFQRYGAGGLISNLLAIPYVTLVTLPLTLLACLFSDFPGAWSEVPAFMAADSAHYLSLAIETLAGGAELISQRVAAPSAVSAALATLGALLMFGPGGVVLRSLGLLVYLPILIFPPQLPVAGQLQMDVLDVGQGTSVLLSTRDHTLLYDTGPGQPEAWDLYESVLQPMFAHTGREPQWVMLSHADLDHSGGASTLRELDIGSHWLASLPQLRPGMATCHNQRHWRWNQYRFQILHPSAWLPYLGNNSSCVLSVGTPGYALLLPGDINHQAERRLVLQGIGPHQLMLAPHHASDSSSSMGFLRVVKPEIVISTTGQNNRFGFPKAVVTERYRELGITHWDTAACGGIRVFVDRKGVVLARSARRARASPWRWPASPNCP